MIIMAKKQKLKQVTETAPSSNVKSVLIITEKPQAAAKIAAALSNATDHKYTENGVSSYEFERDGKHFIVGCAVGHLFGITQTPGTKAEIPQFNVSWRPNYEGKSKSAAYTKKYYDALKKISK